METLEELRVKGDNFGLLVIAANLDDGWGLGAVYWLLFGYMEAAILALVLITLELDAPDTIHYVPEFISAAEERRMLERVYAAPRPRWTQLAHRRLQNWGGLPHPRGMLPEKIPEWLQAPMERIAALGCFGSLRPNHVLVNEYLSGQGIMPHTDGPLFTPVITTVTLGSHALLDLYTPRDHLPVQDADSGVAMPACPSPAAPEAGPEQQEPTGSGAMLGSLLLAPRSLLVVRHDAYHRLLHGIEPRTEDVITDDVFNRGDSRLGERLTRGTRVSLTIRHVPKVLKTKLRL